MAKNRKNKVRHEKRPGTKWMCCEEFRKLFDLDNLKFEIERNEFRNSEKKNN